MSDLQKRIAKLRVHGIGPYVANKYRRQYCKYNKWKTFQDWRLQPEQTYLILCELMTKAAVDALLGNDSWTKRIPKALTRAEALLTGGKWNG